MAHHLYTTRAFVIDSTPSGEASRFIALFTKELGMIRAMARGVREGKSKLRGALQPLSFVDVSLVRGKEIWRLTGASGSLSLPIVLRGERKRLELAARAASLVSRLVHGEEKNEGLFDTFDEGMRYLAEEKLEGESLQNFECALVLRVLYHLGYLGEEQWRPFFSSPLSKEILDALSPIRSSAIVAINRSLRETHL